MGGFSSFKSFGSQVAIPKLLIKVIMINEFILNDSFEFPIISESKSYISLTESEKLQFEWLGGGNSNNGPSISDGSTGYGFPSFVTGSQALAMQSTSFIEQIIYLNVGTYIFSTYFISRFGTQNNPIAISIDGNILTTINQVVNSWTLFTYTFDILEEGNKKIRLEGTSTSDLTTGIDLVAIAYRTFSYTPVKNPFTSANLTINDSTNPNQNGNYIASHSSDQGYGNFWNAFNGTKLDNAFISASNYGITGNYNGTFSTSATDSSMNTLSYLGEWLQIKLPNPILLKRYSLIGRFGAPRADMKIWYLLGSNNGITWDLIDSQDISTRDYWTPFFNNKIASNFDVSTTNSYSYYRVVINFVFPYNETNYGGYAGVAQLNLSGI
jgi:hypothetical protein